MKKDIVFDNKVCDKIRKIKPQNLSTEIGGIILGSVFDEYVLITDISMPCKKDKAGKNFFIRNKENGNKIVEQVYKESNGSISYLGEWHTHLEDIPIPSTEDIRLMWKAFKLVTPALMLIIGMSRSWLGVVNNIDDPFEIGIFNFNKVPYEVS